MHLLRCLTSVIIMLAVLLPAGTAQADGLLWHSTNIQLLRGAQFELGPAKRSLATVEHAHAWRFGDFFGFSDFSRPDGGDVSYYLELSPRLSLRQITGRSLAAGPITDVLLSFTVEKPDALESRILGGIGVDLRLPGFSFFNASLYLRENPDLDGQTLQATFAWSRPFSVAGLQFVTEGFADFAGTEDSAAANQLVVPRLLVGLGDLVSSQQGAVWLGIEWSYWRHKFGVSGVTESVPQAQLKWVL